ncbi:MAG TPA: hypothetical protein VHZ95_15185 [Polyangiales bacterium]|nr:hypothetical protein [Polyangiales bacterium]
MRHFIERGFAADRLLEQRLEFVEHARDEHVAFFAGRRCNECRDVFANVFLQVATEKERGVSHVRIVDAGMRPDARRELFRQLRGDATQVLLAGRVDGNDEVERRDGLDPTGFLVDGDEPVTTRRDPKVRDQLWDHVAGYRGLCDSASDLGRQLQRPAVFVADRPANRGRSHFTRRERVRQLAIEQMKRSRCSE